MQVSSFLRWASLFLFAAVLATLVPCVHAQSPDKADAVGVGGGHSLTLGGLIQTDAYAGCPTQDGFRIRTTRLRLAGRAPSLDYAIQTDFAGSPLLLDAFARVHLSPRIRIRAGLFKTPFSAEFLTSRPDLLFAERARVSNNIPPKRQVGATLGAEVLPDHVTATMGAFNGPRGPTVNDNNHLLYVGRLEASSSLGPTQIEGGINAAYSIDDGVTLPRLRPAQNVFVGTRVLYGLDGRVETDRWLLVGELNVAQLDPKGPVESRSAWGYSLAAAMNVADASQMLVRFDRFDPDSPVHNVPDERLTFGYNYDPTSMLRVLLNYEASVDDLGGGFVTARLQIVLR